MDGGTSPTSWGLVPLAAPKSKQWCGKNFPRVPSARGHSCPTALSQPSPAGLPSTCPRGRGAGPAYSFSGLPGACQQGPALSRAVRKGLSDANRTCAGPVLGKGPLWTSRVPNKSFTLGTEERQPSSMSREEGCGVGREDKSWEKVPCGRRGAPDTGHCGSQDRPSHPDGTGWSFRLKSNQFTCGKDQAGQ